MTAPDPLAETPKLPLPRGGRPNRQTSYVTLPPCWSAFPPPMTNRIYGPEVARGPIRRGRRNWPRPRCCLTGTSVHRSSTRPPSSWTASPRPTARLQKARRRGLGGARVGRRGGGRPHADVRDRQPRLRVDVARGGAYRRLDPGGGVRSLQGARASSTSCATRPRGICSSMPNSSASSSEDRRRAAACRCRPSSCAASIRSTSPASSPAEPWCRWNSSTGSDCRRSPRACATATTSPTCSSPAAPPG